MKVKSIVVLLLAAVLFTSCATLPNKHNGKGILSVYIDADKTKSEYYYAHYRFYYDDNSFFIVDPALNKSFALNLEPGRYTIKKLEITYNTTGEKASESEVNIPFEIKPDTITILSKKIKVWFEEKNGNMYQCTNIENVKPDEIETMKASVAKMENGSLWRNFNY